MFESLNIQGRLDNLLEIGLGIVAEQGYEQLYWKIQLHEFIFPVKECYYDG